ncbi:MAG: cold shock domain-containing protein [Candidatus Omnitrophota bacterium]
MARGKVKWFSNKKGYGFIECEEGKDVFVHYQDIQGDGFKTLREEEEVEFEMIEGEKGLKALNVMRV